MRLVKFEKVHPTKYFNVDLIQYIVDHGLDRKGKHRGIGVMLPFNLHFYSEITWPITIEEFIDAVKSSNPL